MKGQKQKTYVATAAEAAKKTWYVVDAKDRTLGRMATRIATVLMGKHKPTYTPFLDTGDFVVVLNADKFKLSGKKRETKSYDHYTGYPSGRRVVSLDTLLKKKPEEAVRQAVRRMLPSTTLGRYMFKKLKVYAGTEHPHTAQNPKLLEVR